MTNQEAVAPLSNAGTYRGGGAALKSGGGGLTPLPHTGYGPVGRRRSHVEAPHLSQHFFVKFA